MTRKRGKWIFRILIAALLCVMFFSAYKIGSIVYEYHKGTKVYEEIAEKAVIEEEGEGESLSIDFDALKKESEDVIGWLYSEGTVINYPVVQGDDNSYYLYRLINGVWNVKGSLFADYRCENPFEDFNTIIYGHRMNDGSMFRSLLEYRDEAGYYEEHKVMKLLTPDAEYDVEIFGGATIAATSEMYKTVFASDEEKTAYIEWIRENNEIPGDGGSEVEVSADDKIVMLSTCTYEFNEARMVVWGKLTEVSE